MKNQYFGDINDYRKYGLLRALQPAAEGRLLVAWMLTPDDSSRDGGFRSYLQDPSRWRGYDPNLFDGLTTLLRSASAPDVSLIERSGLLPNTTYYSAVVPDQRDDRDTWRQGLFEAARDVGLAFADPDTGIEVPSKAVGRKGSSKYVTWTEVQGLWQAGSSLLLYQHFRREKRDRFAEWLASELRECTGASFVEAFRTPHVLFLLAAQDRHASHLREVVPLLAQQWYGQIEPLGLANPPCTRRLAPPVSGSNVRHITKSRW